MLKKLLFFTLTFLLLQAQSQTLTAYQLFNAKGQTVSIEDMLQACTKADVILFGELHNDPICHWLQYETARFLIQQGPLSFGAEMFEADNQEALTNYLAGNIDAKGLDTLARLWKNYPTDYAPLVELAKAKQAPFIATNIPRPYANKVYKGGFEALDTLPATEKAWIAPLPIAYDSELPGYKQIKAMAHGHGGDNLPKAQAIKDATMAHFILQNKEDGIPFIHFHGAYHSKNYEGILWYLKQQEADWNYLTISTELQANPLELEETNKGTADFILVVDEDMTPTHKRGS